MGRQIIKQPNGFYAMWSSSIDNFIYIDCTPEELVTYLVEEANTKIEHDTLRTVELMEEGKPQYFQFTLKWDEALERIAEIHGAAGIDKLNKELASAEELASTHKNHKMYDFTIGGGNTVVDGKSNWPDSLCIKMSRYMAFQVVQQLVNQLAPPDQEEITYTNCGLLEEVEDDS